MARTRIVVPGTVGKSIRLPEASRGATIGQDLLLPSGQVATVASLRQLLAVDAIVLPGGGGSSSGSGATAILWRLIREIPANIEALQALSGAGLAVRLTGGAWALRVIEAGASDLVTVADGNGASGSIVIDLSAAAQALLVLAGSAVQPGALAAVATSGVYADLVNAPPRYITQTVSSEHYDASDFLRGQNIIGVRYAGAADVFLPHNLPIETLVTVKDELGSGGVTVIPY